jgi:hypothetical protein
MVFPINLDSIDEPVKKLRDKKKKVSTSPSRPITRSARRRQTSMEDIEHEEPVERASRATPSRKAKQTKLEPTDSTSTTSKKRTTKKKEEKPVETPLRTIVTRRMARNNQ